MSDETTVYETDREKLGNRLDQASRKLCLKTDHFVGSKSLCTSCRWAFIARQASKNHRLIHCTGGYPGGFIPDDIIECNSYSNITELRLAQMADLAILIGDKERKVGFHKEGDNEAE